ncbi:metallophosphoesterase [Candidatus Woesearchaeota archaeon]|nr:metallophosphoesterase [Candidatus Woesearchaeota archaeon]
MKIYVFSDFHAQGDYLEEMQVKAAQADLVISAGDHSVFEFDQDNILQAFNNWNKPLLIIHGNHEEEGTLRQAVKKHPNLTFTHGEEIVKKGVRILFWGGGGFTSTDRALNKKVKEWKRSQHARLPTVLVTHAPPHNTALDDIDGRHVGNKTIRKAIKQLKPRYAVSGHIHEAEGAEDNIGDTVCYNLGPRGRIITL